MSIRLGTKAIFLGILAASAAAPVFGQGFSGRGRDEPPRTPEEAQQRFRRTEFFLSEMDANHNGILEADECSGRRQEFVERMLQRAGLPTTFPVALDRVREGLNRYYTASIQGATPGQPMPGQPGAPPGTPPGANPATASAAQSLVPGFGIAAVAAAPIQGFGATGVLSATKPGAAGGAPSSAGSAAKPGSPPSPPSQSDEERKYRDYAKNLLGQYDKNHNGVLERDEWGAMSNSPKAADRNGDGTITFEELAAWLIDVNKPSGHGSGSSSDGGKQGNSKKVSIRIPSAIERLPSGLPDWFVKKDTNADGQISMAEFAQDWSDARVSEFAKYDVNRDGVVTPAEYLRMEKEAKATSKSEKRDGPPSDPGPPSRGWGR
jgi:Ca2+-binding EF-hand superfamily protein